MLYFQRTFVFFFVLKYLVVIFFHHVDRIQAVIAVEGEIMIFVGDSEAMLLEKSFSISN